MSAATIIGRNIRPGSTPGGFTAPIGARNHGNPPRRRTSNGLYANSCAIREAASRALERLNAANRPR